MIGVIFQFASEHLEVRIDNDSVYFRTTGQQSWSTIEGLQLDYMGVTKEFPDLNGEPQWKNIAIQRFKDKINSFKTENEKVNYIIEDLAKHGYVAKFKQRSGFRPEKIR